MIREGVLLMKAINKIAVFLILASLMSINCSANEIFFSRGIVCRLER